MAPTVHQLGQAGTSRSGPCEPGVPEVMEVEVGPADGVAHLVPNALEVTRRDSRAGGRPEQPGGGLGPYEALKVLLQGRHDVLGYVEGAAARLSFRRAYDRLLTGRDHPGLLDRDGPVQQVDVSPLQCEDLAPPQLAPRRQEDGGVVAVGDSLDRVGHLGDRKH